MKNRISEKIKEVQKFLEELDEIVPATFEDYISDTKSRAACERYFEKIIEGVVDLSFMVIKWKKLEVPEDEGGSFVILEKNGFLASKLSQSLQKAKGMRNILVHEYGKIDDKTVYRAIREQLNNDIQAFLNDIAEKIK